MISGSGGVSSTSAASAVSSLDEQLAKVDVKLAAPDMADISLFSNKMQAMPKHIHAIRFLREEAKNFDSNILDKLRPLRIYNSEMKRRRDDLEFENEALSKQIAEINEGLAQYQEGSTEHAEATQQLADAKKSISQNHAKIDRLGPRETRELGWAEQWDWELKPGERVEVDAKGFLPIAFSSKQLGIK